MTINIYVKRLKSYADGLADLGFPMAESTLILTFFHGLTTPYCHMASIIKAKDPPPSLSDARSQLALEDSELKIASTKEETFYATTTLP
ncbi:hypothetical protein PR202_ga24533 [Eleusine coracana subsp. coracana]|uniref:Uncharacterized protein n=1 Tax=Eleusine coracana subsp. coracana TaxID=191504 RepID=A0AAV5D8S3_ELECO|nr:hypothetical protein PR202_ga24533 [Eleusine coracana subsp. coracana]